MLTFRLSAFADEYSPDFDKQIEGVKKNGIGMIEIRGVNGKNVADLTEEEMKSVREKLDASGIKLSSIGSPIGKIKITDPFEPHLEALKNCIRAAKIMGTDRIRIFSFYIPAGMTRAECRCEVMRRLGVMLALAESEGITLCHENELGIWGEGPEECLEIYHEFEGRIKLIFDPANFISDGYESYPHAYELLGDKIFYMHIKDADAERLIVPAGQGLGGIPEILADLNEKRDGELILTLEPHLKIFDGFKKLEDRETKTKIANTFATNEEAFACAAGALKSIIEKI